MWIQTFVFQYFFSGDGNYVSKDHKQEEEEMLAKENGTYVTLTLSLMWV